MNPIAMTILLTGGFGIFAISIARRWRLLFASTTRQPATQSNFRRRWRRVVVEGLFQSRLRQYTWAGLAHSLVFFGFLILLARTLLLWGRGFSPGFDLWILGSAPVLDCPVGELYNTLKDCCSGLVLIAVAFFLAQRLWWRPGRLTLSKEGILILAIIAAMMIADEIYDGSSILLANTWDHGCPNGGSAHCESLVKLVAGVGKRLHRLEWRAFPDPLGSLTALALQPLQTRSLVLLAHLGFWTHSVLVVLFLNLLPYSKHFHVLTALPNLFLSSTELPGKLQKIAETAEALLEQADASQSVTGSSEALLGISRIDDLTWKDRLDLYSCTECGRCSEHCPAHRVGKPLSPKQFTLDLRGALFKDSDRLLAPPSRASLPGQASELSARDAQLVPFVIEPETVWSCTTCRACEQQCPVGISYVDKIVDLRRNLVLIRGEVSPPLQRSFEGMERNGNPWNLPRSERSDWTLGLGVRRIADVPRTDILYWVGCAASYDERARRVAKSFVSLLQQANVDFAILGDEETCTGDSARRAGNEYLFLQLAQANIATLNRYYAANRFRRIVTTCPHCLTTLKNEYPDFGGRWPIVHHVEFLLELTHLGQLMPNKSAETSVVFHDPCTLARYANDVVSPRRLLRAIPNVSLREPEHHSQFTLCCGAGGARMWMDDGPTSRMNEARSRELLATGAEQVVTACPFCATMIGDGVLQSGSAQNPSVLDITEVFAKACTNESASK